MARIDLDGPKAARREALAEPPMLLFEGTDYPLAIELPDALMDEVAHLPNIPDGATPTEEEAEVIMGAMRKLAAAVLGPSWDVLRPRLSAADLQEIVNQLAPVYGFDTPGESSASADSS